MTSMGALRMFRILWAAPNSLIGIAFGLFFRRWRFARGVLLAEGAEWPRRLGWRYSAITMGHVVLSVKEPISEAVLEHELVHVRQYETFGPFFLPLYWAASLAAIVRGRHFYRDNLFEARARAASGH
jgi:hypothetical protein